MKKSLNQNVHYLEMTLAASGIDAAPIVSAIPLVGDLVSRINVAVSVGIAYVKFLDVEHQITPVSGFMIATPGWNDVKLDREIEGPPWRLEVQAYNPGAAENILYILVEVGDSKEKDTEAMILANLEALSIKEPK